MRLRFLVACGVGVAAGVLLAADAARLPGYVAAYHAFAAALACGAIVLVGLGLSVAKPTRPAAAAVLVAGIAFYAAFVGAMLLLRRSGAWAERTVALGPPTRGDLIVVFRRDANPREIERLLATELSVPARGGGRWPRSGVSGFVSVRVVDREGYSVSFRPDATDEQRADVRRGVERSPLVARVLENARWDEVQPAYGPREGTSP